MTAMMSLPPDDNPRRTAWEAKRLKSALTEMNKVCQTLGKALGYPWYKDDQKNFPGATEADGVCIGDHVAESLAVEAAARLTAQSLLALAAPVVGAVVEKVPTCPSCGEEMNGITHGKSDCTPAPVGENVNPLNIAECRCADPLPGHECRGSIRKPLPSAAAALEVLHKSNLMWFEEAKKAHAEAHAAVEALRRLFQIAEHIAGELVVVPGDDDMTDAHVEELAGALDQARVALPPRGEVGR